MADDLDEALARVDLIAKDLAEVAGLGAEDFLNDGRVAQPCKDGRDSAACLAELRRNAGDKDGRLVHRLLLPEYFCRVLALAFTVPLLPGPNFHLFAFCEVGLISWESAKFRKY
jgi:hypothetical protein